MYRGVGDTNVGRRVQFDWLQDRYDDIKAFYGTWFPEQVQEIVQVRQNEVQILYMYTSIPPSLNLRRASSRLATLRRTSTR